jgi:hypothetical protein
MEVGSSGRALAKVQASRNTLLPQSFVAASDHCCDSFRAGRKLADTEHEIYDRLGDKAWNGGAADVLQRRLNKGGRKQCAFAFKRRCPSGLMRLQVNGLVDHGLCSCHN